MDGTTVIGIDPGKNEHAVAVVNAHEGKIRLLEVCMVRARDEPVQFNLARALAACLESLMHWSPTVVCVEGQQVYPDTPDPNDIVQVARTAGGVEGVVAAMSYGRLGIICPLPRVWKGQVPKPIHQARIYGKLGIQCAANTTYAYPTGDAVLAKVKGAAKVSKGDWKHIGDAVGLGIYALVQLVAVPKT